MSRPCRTIALAALLSLSSACSILPKAEPADVYRLPAAQPVRSNAAPVAWTLRINKPLASEVLAGPKIAVIPQGDVNDELKTVLL